MTTRYWVAKYVADPFRNEPRNVGVFVHHCGSFAAKLVGEREDGVLDNRRLRGLFPQPQVFAQWQKYWRKNLNCGKIEKIVKSATTNFVVVEGGVISDTGNDAIYDVCNFVYNLVVSDDGAAEAFDWPLESAPETDLASDIYSTFLDARVLADAPDIEVSHPVRKNQTIQGKRVKHTPTFSQMNGHLSVFEAIDLGRPKQKLVRERAGWMAYMFTDIKDNLHDAEMYSIIQPNENEEDEAISFARSVLEKSSHVVNWSDKEERQNFLQQRIKVAVSLG